MDTQAELDRLAGALGKALDCTATTRLLPYAGDCLYAYANTRDHRIETAAHAMPEAAVAELRAILRADTDGAVADVLDELAAEMERGPLTAEMLRVMAAARRSR